MLDMRAAAEISEITVGIEGDCAVFEVVYQFALVLVALLREVVKGLGLGHLPAFESLLGLGELLHLILYGLEVGIRNLTASEVDIIIETRFNGRAYSELYARIEGLQRLGHQMSRRMPEYPFRLVIVPGADRAVGKCNCQHIIICF